MKDPGPEVDVQTNDTLAICKNDIWVIRDVLDRSELEIDGKVQILEKLKQLQKKQYTVAVLNPEILDEPLPPEFLAALSCYDKVRLSKELSDKVKDNGDLGKNLSILETQLEYDLHLSLIHISEPTRPY